LSDPSRPLEAFRRRVLLLQSVKIGLHIDSPETPAGCFFQPAVNRVPGNSLDSSDRGLIQTFDTESSHLIKDRTPVLKSIIRCPDCRAEGLSTSPALVAATLPRPSRVKAVANEDSDVAFSQGRAVPVGTAEALRNSALIEGSPGGVELSLKLCHAGELQVGMLEALIGRQAPAFASTPRSFRTEVAHRFGSSQIAVIEAEGFELA
jgi:hypothetical protein